MKYVISGVLLIIVGTLTLPGCSQNIIDRGDVFPAVEQTISKPGPVRDDLIARGLVTYPTQSSNISNPAPGEIHFAEIEQLVEDGIYVIDEDGYLQFGPSYTPLINTPPPWTPPIVLEPATPPSGAYVLTGGIRIIPSVASPWPDVPVILSPGLIQVKKGDEFSVGLDISRMLGNSWSADFDESVLSLVDRETVTFDPGQMLGTCWFRFKATGREYSYTLITFDYTGPDGDLLTRFQFGINVIEKE